jgi:hypothetical protein
MTPRLRSLIAWTQSFGLDPFATRSALQNLKITLQEYFRFRDQNSKAERGWNLTFSNPVFGDRADASGVASGHYFHQDLLVARRIYERNPERHVDIGSRIDGFVAHVASYRKLEVFDIRPMAAKVPNIEFRQVDMSQPGDAFENYCDSISCLHALEHFGLGRYGDPVDVDGYEKGFENISHMLKENGIFYLSVPIGKERVEFNAQRVFSLRRLVDLFGERFRPICFSYVDDEGVLWENADLMAMLERDEQDLYYGCGIFELLKIEDHGKSL